MDVFNLMERSPISCGATGEPASLADTGFPGQRVHPYALILTEVTPEGKARFPASLIFLVSALMTQSCLGNANCPVMTGTMMASVISRQGRTSGPSLEPPPAGPLVEVASVWATRGHQSHVGLVVMGASAFLPPVVRRPGSHRISSLCLPFLP